MTPPYAELHCHSAYSLREGASTPEELVLRAKELGYPALALTDHDGLYGAMEFAQHARAWGIRPITGAEVTLTTGGHLTLLCERREGYANLCRILAHACRRGKDDPAVDPAFLSEHAAGLLALTGCPPGRGGRRSWRRAGRWTRRRRCGGSWTGSGRGTSTPRSSGTTSRARRPGTGGSSRWPAGWACRSWRRTTSTTTSGRATAYASWGGQ